MSLKKIADCEKGTVLQKVFFLSIIIVIFTAFFLRLWGIDFGLPFLYHTDEWFEIKRALKLGNGVFDFERATKGGFFYILFIEYGFYYIYLLLTSQVSNGYEFLVTIFRDPTILMLISRATNALLGTFNCVLIYLLTAKLHNKYSGLFAALILAIFPLHIKSSHYTTVDVMLTLFITLYFYILFSNIKGRYDSHLKYSLLGVVVALAGVTKITGLVVILSMLVYHFFICTNKGKLFFRALINKKLITFVLSFVLVYIILNPGIVLKFTDILKFFISFFLETEFSEKMQQYPLPIQDKSLLHFYFSALFPFRYFGLAVVFFMGVFLFSKKNLSRSIILLSFMLPYFFFLISSSSKEHIYARYLLPLVPFVCMYASIASIEILQKKIRPVYKTVMGVFIVSIIAFPIFIDTVSWNNNLTKEDTRTNLYHWVQGNIPSDSLIVTEGGWISVSPLTVPLKFKPDLIAERLSWLTGDQNINKKTQYYRALMEAIGESQAYNIVCTDDTENLERVIKEDKIECVILRNKFIEINSLIHNKERFPVRHNLVSIVTSTKFVKVIEVRPDSRTRGPALSVFRRKTADSNG